MKTEEPTVAADASDAAAPRRELPLYAKAGVMPETEHIRVIDVETGLPIEKVIEASVTDGWVVRRLIENGNYVRTQGGFGNELETVREDRAIRFEWIEL